MDRAVWAKRHLAIRLLAANQRIKVFTFSEKTPAGQSLLNQLQNYLTKEKKQFNIVSELALIPKQTDKFFKLLEKVSEQCDPIFLFDNMESFQKFDTEEQSWIWHQEKHEDILQLMQILGKQSPFPLIITGRYPIAEFPDLDICNMNTVPFGDFFRKCHQLGISELAQKLRTGAMLNSPLKRTDENKPPTFEEVIRLLHKTFGGNYRALEFFDELYTKKGEEIFKTLHQLADFESKLAEKEIKEGVLTRMSENLIFEELLTYLNERDKDTLFVLAQFNIPVLPMAIGMQRNSEDRTDSLDKAVNLTLVERQKGIDGRERFYVMPLVRDLLKEVGIKFGFEEKVAGDYHVFVVEEEISLDNLANYLEAFYRYLSIGTKSKINEVGDELCEFYYNAQQLQTSFSIGEKTRNILHNKTYGRILNNLGRISHIYGDSKIAIKYFNESLNAHRKHGNRQGEATVLNNISQIYQDKGELEKTVLLLEQALEITKEINDLIGQYNILNNLAIVKKEQGFSEDWLSNLETALEIAESIEDYKGAGIILNNISHFYVEKKNIQKATYFLNLSLKYLQNDLMGKSVAMSNFAHILKESGELELAHIRYMESLALCKEYGNIRHEAMVLFNLGGLLFKQEEYEKALPHLIQSYQIFRQINSPFEKKIDHYLYEIFTKLGEPIFKKLINNLYQNK